MADTQGLQEFTENLLSDLSSGAISSHEAVIAAAQYAYLRDAIQSKSGALSEAELIGEDNLTSLLQNVIAEVLEGVKELPNFQNQNPDIPAEENDIREAAALRKHAVERIQETSKTRVVPYKEKRRAFVHDLVTKFSSTLPLDEDRVNSAFDAAAARASAEASPAKSRFAELLITSLEASGGLPETEKGNLASSIRESVEANSEYVEVATNQARQNKTLFKTLLEHPEIRRPDVLVDIVLHAPPSETAGETLTRATKLAQVAQSLDETAGKPRGGRLQFFSSDGAKGMAAGIQKGADGMLSLIGEPVRNSILREKTNGTLRSMLSSSQQFVDRLGENFVKSSLFTHIAQDLTKQLSEKPSGGKVGSVFGDVFSTVFRGPLDIYVQQGAKERLLDFFELARANAAAPKGHSFLPQGMLPWDVFLQRENGFGGLGSRHGGLGGSWFPRLGLTQAGNFLGNVFSAGVDRTTSYILSSPRIGRQMGASRRAAALPIPLGQDMPLLVALVIVIVLVLLFIFPSFLNMPQTAHSAKVSSILASLVQKDAATEPGTNDNGWPVACGCIINGPYEDTHSGGKLNAIDFSFKRCKPSTNVGLFAIEKGKVTLVSKGYGIGETCMSKAECHGKSTYGNYIEITMSEGPSKGLTILYAHMATIRVREGQSVNKGDLVGTSNHNGLSYGEHLHFELLGGSSHPALNQTNPITPQAATNGLCIGI